MITQKMYIAGEWVDGAAGDVIDVTNPATEEVFATVPSATEQDVDLAIDAAQRALAGWSALSPFDRGEYLRSAAHLVLERSREIASLMTQEQGKPLAEAEGEVKKGAAILRYYAEEGERITGRIIANSEANRESHVVYEPVGVCGAISPWNYPIELLAWKVGGALAAGCVQVAKVPSLTPLSPFAFAKCLANAGLPAGVLNVVSGPGATAGAYLAASDRLDKLSFTGSTEVGRSIYRTYTSSFKKISLELGGSLPMVVEDDCDLNAAVKGAVRRSFRNMGQICIAVNRIYVHADIYDVFLDRFVEATTRLTIGNGLADDCDLGPMATTDGVAATQAHIHDALSKGATLLCGGRRPPGDKYARGYFFEPSVLADADHSMDVMQKETFGPLVGVMKYGDLEEAIELANDNQFGLAAVIYSTNSNKIRRFVAAVKAGNIAVNNVDAGVINAPYGGWKESGLGYEHGVEGLFEFLKPKHVRYDFS